ncbi:MAG TPA: LysR substrate-binding domain-containing protein [Pseudonocardia sp.]
MERNHRRNLDPRLIEPFVVLGDRLHFGSASAALGISQQTLSDQIRRLERQLDLVLFTRNSRHVDLTADGKRLLVDAQHALSAFDRLVYRRDGHVLRLGVVKDYGPALPLIEEFCRLQPNCSMDIVDASSDEQLDALRAGAIDVGILRVAGAAPSGVTVAPLQLEPVLVTVGPDHPLAGAATIPLADLTRILCGAGPAWAARREWLDALAVRVGARWIYTAGCGPSTVNASYLAGDRTLANLVPASSTAPFVAAGCAVRPPRELQPYYAWSIAWRSRADEYIEGFVRHALRARDARGWLELPLDSGGRQVWLPESDPAFSILASAPT